MLCFSSFFLDSHAYMELLVCTKRKLCLKYALPWFILSFKIFSFQGSESATTRKVWYREVVLLCDETVNQHMTQTSLRIQWIMQDGLSWHHALDSFPLFHFPIFNDTHALLCQFTVSSLMWMKEHNQLCTAPAGKTRVITERWRLWVAATIWLEAKKQV